MELVGKIKVKGNTESFGANGFEKREVVVVTEEQYPQTIMVEFIQGNCTKVDPFNIGQVVKIAINLKGREWTNQQGEVKYFNSIQGWRIESSTVQNDLP